MLAELEDKIRELKTAWRAKALAPDTMFLLRPSDAVEFIDAGAAKGVSLAGIEGFLISDAGAFQPMQEFSNDIAEWPGSYEHFLKQTKQLILSVADRNIRFEVVFEAAQL